ncbi:FAD-binding protein [Subtercola boreus]|uniref:FAD-binding protein n=1 Tax=Subtercola boreus TaxID=120213 RepID=A0A3E0VEW8_9MICO|nr:FAD-binding oxidoreductase [Subtercola boreus]RFA08093.1 FAD-binding protein [Subtercola boreus]TQL55020.1 FAD/FMN-containing dehydrogenase [Subtercola boreus]
MSDLGQTSAGIVPDLGALPGRVVRAGDDGYDAARRSWNHLFSHRPAALVYPQSTPDVVAAVSWARNAGVPLRVRSGGHCLEGWSTLDDGLVIDVSELVSVTIDAENHTATVGAGVSQAAAVAALGAAGFAAPTGTEGSVGLAGATLGGGFGLLTRAFGMACDNLLSVEIVVASGAEAGAGAEAITVDSDHHGELLRALRGAGNGSFGVVTALTFAVHPLARVASVTATWPGLTALAEVFDVWQRTAPFADERLTSQLEIDRQSVVLFAVLASGDEREALRMLEPLLAIGSPHVVTTDAPWAQTYAGFQIPTGDEPANWTFRSQFVTEPLPPEAIDIIGSFLASAPTEGCNYFTNAFGGVVSESEPRGGSAFAHRDALFYAEPGAGWGVRGGVAALDDPLTPVCLAWVAAFAAALKPYGNGAYPNVPNVGADSWARDYWGPDLARLSAVKRAYDPADVFRFEQSVPQSA